MLRKGIAQKIAVYVGVILLVTLVSMGVLSYQMAANAVTDEIEETLLILAEKGAEYVEETLDHQLSVLETIAGFHVISSPEVELEEKIDFLKAERERNNFINIGISDERGNLVLADGQSSIDIRDRDYFQKAMRGEKNVSDPIINRQDQSMVVVYAVPLYHNNFVSGVLMASRDVEILSLITDEMGFGERGYANILSSDGLTIAHANRDLIYEQTDFIEMAETDPAFGGLAAAFVRMMEGEHGIALYEFFGEDRYMAFAPVGETGWSIAVGSFADEVLAGVYSLRNFFIAGALAFIGLGFISALMVGRSIAAPIKETSSHANIMATGDFTSDIPEQITKTNDEVGVLAKSFDAMQQSLREMLSRVKEGTNKVNMSSDSLASSSEEMSASLEQVAASANEFSNNAQNLSSSSNSMSEQGHAISEKAEEGTAAVQKAILQMDNISGIIDGLKETVYSLNDRTQSIGKIVDAIKGIAEQTNLLALNAAIEAARAGEQGRGFAVVAEEVRKLAEQSAVSASEITDLIYATQVEAQKAADNMDKGVEEVQQGTEVITSAGTVLNSIIESIEQIVNHIEQVAAASQEIGAGSEEVSAAVEEQTATMTDIANAATELQMLVNELNEVVDKFKY